MTSYSTAEESQAFTLRRSARSMAFGRFTPGNPIGAPIELLGNISGLTRQIRTTSLPMNLHPENPPLTPTAI